MSNKISIGIITFVLMIGLASAAMPPFDLTTSNNPELNGIIIRVIPGDNSLSVQLINNPVTNTPLGIDQFFYNLDGEKTSRYTGPYIITSVFDPRGTWPSNKLNFNGTTADGFGTFISHRSKTSPAGYGGISDPITFNLASSFADIPKNNREGRIAVHIRFDRCSGWISDATSNSGQPDHDLDGGTTFGCTRPGNNIPEFPSVALPVAAVIGLLFLFQHKKNKEE